jgi:hypothetical protein
VRLSFGVGKAGTTARQFLGVGDGTRIIVTYDGPPAQCRVADIFGPDNWQAPADPSAQSVTCGQI